MLSVCVAGFLLINELAIYWFGPLVAGLAPMVNLVFPYDKKNSPHHKVKLPMVSLLVMLSVALVLLTVPERGLALWLTLGCLGGFLLDTYWARESV
ncbi:MAG: hypothetical protein OIF34_11610 [Porticoccaceae bacterium]|nr:hypothetical protein [Porticoccaceae bacterium]